MPQGRYRHDISSDHETRDVHRHGIRRRARVAGLTISKVGELFGPREFSLRNFSRLASGTKFPYAKSWWRESPPFLPDEALAEERHPRTYDDLFRNNGPLSSGVSQTPRVDRDTRLPRVTHPGLI